MATNSEPTPVQKAIEQLLRELREGYEPNHREDDEAA